MLSFNKVSLQDLPHVALQIADHLRSYSWFNVSLHGEMGVGKTTFSGHLLHALGVPSAQPVTSPTFTYLNEYMTASGKLLAHLDMYRAEVGMSLEDLGASDQRNFWGILVEWPEHLIEPAPTHTLRLEFAKGSEDRRIEFSIADESGRPSHRKFPSDP